MVRLESEAGRQIVIESIAGWSEAQAARSPFVEPYILLLAGTLAPSEENVFEELIASAISNGCRYFVFWGEGCERMEDLADHLCTKWEDAQPDKGALIPTASWPEEGVEYAAWYAAEAAEIPKGRAASGLLCWAVGNVNHYNQIFEELENV